MVKLDSRNLKLFSLLAFIVLLISCENKSDQNHQHNNGEPQTKLDTNLSEIIKGVSTLRPTDGNIVSGTVVFSKALDGVNVKVDITGLTPGKHGFHIHEFGDCSAADGKSAGGHFDMDGHNHGAPGDTVRHAGDLGNLEANESGEVHIEFVDKTISLNGVKSIVGRSLIIHENEDDMKTQPTGNAGPRVACGVIGVSKN